MVAIPDTDRMPRPVCREEWKVERQPDHRQAAAWAAVTAVSLMAVLAASAVPELGKALLRPALALAVLATQEMPARSVDRPASV
jgi:hypothetical protein